MTQFPAAVHHLALTVTDHKGYHHTIFALGGGLLLSLHGHAATDTGQRFDELRPGLDHVGFGCADRDELERLAERLDGLGIEHGGINADALGHALSFRDPDGVSPSNSGHPQHEPASSPRRRARAGPTAPLRRQRHRRGPASGASREERTAPMAHPTEELLRTYFKAAERGDLATLDGLFADNISAHIAGSHALAGNYRGKEAVFGFFGRLAERSGGTARLLLQDAVCDDCFAVALVEVAGRVGGERLDGERRCWSCGSRTSGSLSCGATITTSRR